jgi:hypothetical protein
MPAPRAKTQVFDVPRSMARSWEKSDIAPSSIKFLVSTGQGSGAASGPLRARSVPEMLANCPCRDFLVLHTIARKSAFQSVVSLTLSLAVL